MKKKLLALLLSGAMILTLTTPAAFAEEPEGECCGACGQVVSECICEITDESTPCEVCGEVECVCEDVVELPEEEVPGAAAPEIPEEPTACEVCGEVECVCEEIEEPEVPEVPETPVVPEEPEAEAIAEEEMSLFERLMACETLEEFMAIVEATSEEELFFTCEEFDSVDAHYIYLSTGEYPDYSPVVDEVVETVNFTNVAPLVGTDE